MLSTLRSVVIMPFGERMACRDCQDVAKRQRVERSIIRRLLLEASRAGFTVAEWYDGEEYIDVSKLKEREIIATIFEVEEGTLAFTKTGDDRHGVLLIIGNGPDVISDYHTSLESAMEPVNAYAETFA
jgi:hypothetical protein